MSKSRAPSFSKRDSAACSAKICGRRRVGEGVAEAHAVGDLGDDPPVGPRLARARAGSCRWREMRRSELVTVPSFSPQAAAGSRTWAKRAVSVLAVTSETTTNGQAVIAASTRRRPAWKPTGLVAMIHSALMRPSATAWNMSTAFRPGFARDRRRAPEALHAVAMLRILDLHMRGEHVGEAADLAAAHGVGLAGDRERAHAGLADAAGREMAVDDGVDLVGAGRRLVDALAVDGDRLLGRGEQGVERGQRRRGEARLADEIGRSSASAARSASSKPVVCAVI